MMRPEDVDAELVEKAARACNVTSLEAKRHFERTLRTILAAVLPEYGARLLDQVKRAIQHEASKAELDGDWLRAWNLSTGHAASVVSEHAARLTTTTEEPTT